jgi:hypothetical protein
MGHTFEYHVSLRVTHPTMDPIVISEQVRITPEFFHRAGERRKTPKGSILDGHYAQTYCSFFVGEGKDGELAACLKSAVAQLADVAEALHEIRRGGGSVVFFAFWYPNGDQGEIFDAKLLGKMSELGIDFGLNVFDDRTATS